jgi:hypothetical protein
MSVALNELLDMFEGEGAIIFGRSHWFSNQKHTLILSQSNDCNVDRQTSMWSRAAQSETLEHNLARQIL